MSRSGQGNGLDLRARLSAVGKLTDPQGENDEHTSHSRSDYTPAVLGSIACIYLWQAMNRKVTSRILVSQSRKPR
jgi:hypothetical protein